MLKIKKKFSELEVGNRFIAVKDGEDLVKITSHKAAKTPLSGVYSFALDGEVYWLPTDKDVLHAVMNHPQVSPYTSISGVDRVLSGDLMHLREGILYGDDILREGVKAERVSFAASNIKYQTRPPKQYVKWGDTDIDVPKPMDEYPLGESEYFTIAPCAGVDILIWLGDEDDIMIYNKLGCYDNKEDAQECCNAIRHLFNRHGKKGK